jgi:hypothetical protein
VEHTHKEAVCSDGGATSGGGGLSLAGRADPDGLLSSLFSGFCVRSGRSKFGHASSDEFAVLFAIDLRLHHVLDFVPGRLC